MPKPNTKTLLKYLHPTTVFFLLCDKKNLLLKNDLQNLTTKKNYTQSWKAQSFFRFAALIHQKEKWRMLNRQKVYVCVYFCFAKLLQYVHFETRTQSRESYKYARHYEIVIPLTETIFLSLRTLSLSHTHTYTLTFSPFLFNSLLQFKCKVVVAFAFLFCWKVFNAIWAKKKRVTNAYISSRRMHFPNVHPLILKSNTFESLQQS